MKLKTFLIVSVGLFLTSCYSYTSVVGSGSSSGEKVTKHNHYLLAGLAPVKVSDSKSMAGGAANYVVTTRQTFVDGLISGLTSGLYTPTTTTVIK